MAFTITIKDTVSIATMGEGWADPAAVAATFASQLEDTYFTTATQMYPEAEVEVEVNCADETLGEGLAVSVEPFETEEDFDPKATEEALLEGLKAFKGSLGEAFLTNYEDEEEADDKEELGQ